MLRPFGEVDHVPQIVPKKLGPVRAKALILRSDLWTDGSKQDWRAKKAIQNTLDHSGIVLLNVLTVEQRMMNHAYDTTGS